MLNETTETASSYVELKVLCINMQMLYYLYGSQNIFYNFGIFT